MYNMSPAIDLVVVVPGVNDGRAIPRRQLNSRGTKHCPIKHKNLVCFWKYDHVQPISTLLYTVIVWCFHLYFVSRTMKLVYSEIHDRVVLNRSYRRRTSAEKEYYIYRGETVPCFLNLYATTRVAIHVFHSLLLCLICLSFSRIFLVGPW